MLSITNVNMLKIVFKNVCFRALFQSYSFKIAYCIRPIDEYLNSDFIFITQSFGHLDRQHVLDGELSCLLFLLRGIDLRKPGTLYALKFLFRIYHRFLSNLNHIFLYYIIDILWYSTDNCFLLVTSFNNYNTIVM